MPQQINLCTSVLAPQRERFQARSLAFVLAISLLALGTLGGFWLWSLERSALAYRQTLEAQLGEIKNLQAAIQTSRTAAGPVDPALLRKLEDQRKAVLEREKVLQVVRQGLFQVGQAHSDRLLLLSRSIPADAWVTALHADGGVFEVSGFTLEPASLNDWVAHLGQSPLMQGLQLSSVKVTLVPEPAASKATAQPVAVADKAKPMWSFNLLSQQPLVLPGNAPVAGGKP
jgi:Tfp pilus assembly protein PilN